MPRDLYDPQFLRFMTEIVNKEQEKRLHWFMKHLEKILEAAQFSENYKDMRTAEVKKAYLYSCMPEFAKSYQNSMINRRKKPKQDGQEIGLTLSSTKPEDVSFQKVVMFPVNPKIKNILEVYLPFGGRKQYLKTRNCLAPEEKYYEQETSSNAYGWRLKDSQLSGQYPKYGKQGAFIRNLYNRSGPHADPSYYQQPPIEPYSICEAPNVMISNPGLSKIDTIKR